LGHEDFRWEFAFNSGRLALGSARKNAVTVFSLFRGSVESMGAAVRRSDLLAKALYQSILPVTDPMPSRASPLPQESTGIKKAPPLQAAPLSIR
jgi:hypothetical protein